MKTLKELSAQYGLTRAKYEPNQQCNRCHGEGEYFSKRLGKMHFCICLFIDPSMSNEIGSFLGEYARKMLKENKESSHGV